LVSWPELHRLGLKTEEGVALYEVTATGVEHVETLTRADLGLDDGEAVIELAGYGEGLVVLVDAADGERLVHWDANGSSEMLSLPGGPWSWLIASFVSKRVAVGYLESVLVATETDGEWTLGEPISVEAGRYVKPLALRDGEVVIGVNESNFPEELPAGNGGAGGAGGESGSPDPSARIERWSLEGERLERHETVGSPAIALPLGDGSESYLIGETNNFWGSLAAALERYDVGSSLVKLVSVPVRSSTDGEDGAFDLAVIGDRLFVANCESGLRTTEVPVPGASELPQLTQVEGPWEMGDDRCSARRLEAVDDVLAVGSYREVFFARICSPRPRAK
jgi:hypothetical protein